MLYFFLIIFFSDSERLLKLHSLCGINVHPVLNLICLFESFGCIERKIGIFVQIENYTC